MDSVSAVFRDELHSHDKSAKTLEKNSSQQSALKDILSHSLVHSLGKL